MFDINRKTKERLHSPYMFTVTDTRNRVPICRRRCSFPKNPVTGQINHTSTKNQSFQHRKDNLLTCLEFNYKSLLQVWHAFGSKQSHEQAKLNKLRLTKMLIILETNSKTPNRPQTLLDILLNKNQSDN